MFLLKGCDLRPASYDDGKFEAIRLSDREELFKKEMRQVQFGSVQNIPECIDWIDQYFLKGIRHIQFDSCILALFQDQDAQVEIQKQYLKKNEIILFDSFLFYITKTKWNENVYINNENMVQSFLRGPFPKNNIIVNLVMYKPFSAAFSRLVTTYFPQAKYIDSNLYDCGNNMFFQLVNPGEPPTSD